MGISVKLEVFEGPLDLLLHLIDKNKVDIYDIPIVEITNQYMEYIQEMQKQDLNIRSIFDGEQTPIYWEYSIADRGGPCDEDAAAERICGQGDLCRRSVEMDRFCSGQCVFR